MRAGDTIVNSATKIEKMIDFVATMTPIPAAKMVNPNSPPMTSWKQDKHRIQAYLQERLPWKTWVDSGLLDETRLFQ
jgi:hypothetical protein